MFSQTSSLFGGQTVLEFLTKLKLNYGHFVSVPNACASSANRFNEHLTFHASSQGAIYSITPFKFTKAQFIRRAAAVPNQIRRIKFGSSTVAARRMNRA